jgi:hypothetical protein
MDKNRNRRVAHGTHFQKREKKIDPGEKENALFNRKIVKFFRSSFAVLHLQKKSRKENFDAASFILLFVAPTVCPHILSTTFTK